MHVYKVIIIGAGVAGLAAAKYLHENGFHDFLVLEAQDVVGGRVRTVPFGGGKDHLVELGAQWIHGEENDFFRYVKKSEMVHETTSWEGEGEFCTPTGERVPYEKVKKIMDWVNETLENLEERDDELMITWSKNSSFELSSAEEEKAFTEERQGQGSVGAYMKREFEKYLKECNEQDLPHNILQAIFQWAMRIDNACHQMTDLSVRSWPEFEINGGELYNHFKAGASSTIESLRSKFLNPGNLKLNSPVTRINWQTEEVQVFTTNNNNNDHDANNQAQQQESIYLCQSVFVTCSIGVLQKLKSTLFSPSLPDNISSAIEKTGFGPVTKIFIRWEKPWWPQQDFRGYQLLWPDEFINCCDHSYEEVDMDLGRSTQYDETWVKSITGFDPVLENPGVLLAWLGGPEAIYVESLDEKTVMEKCTEMLRKFTGLRIPSPQAAVVSKWSSNPYIRGAYSYRSVDGDKIPGDITSILRLPIYHEDDLGLLKPALIFAGEGLSQPQYSTVHGAYASGTEQAQLLYEIYNQWQEQREQLSKLYGF